MVICTCSYVTEKQIEDLLPTTLEEVMLKTGAAMYCGTCFKMLQQIVEPVLDSRSE